MEYTSGRPGIYAGELHSHQTQYVFFSDGGVVRRLSSRRSDRLFSPTHTKSSRLISLMMSHVCLGSSSGDPAVAAAKGARRTRGVGAGASVDPEVFGRWDIHRFRGV